jgi:hypothetical protein
MHIHKSKSQDKIKKKIKSQYKKTRKSVHKTKKVSKTITTDGGGFINSLVSTAVHTERDLTVRAPFIGNVNKFNPDRMFSSTMMKPAFFTAIYKYRTKNPLNLDRIRNTIINSSSVEMEPYVSIGDMRLYYVALIELTPIPKLLWLKKIVNHVPLSSSILIYSQPKPNPNEVRNYSLQLYLRSKDAIDYKPIDMSVANRNQEFTNFIKYLNENKAKIQHLKQFNKFFKVRFDTSGGISFFNAITNLTKTQSKSISKPQVV